MLGLRWRTNYSCPPAKAIVGLLSINILKKTLRGQVFFAAMAMKFEKAALPTRENKLQQLPLHCPILPCTSSNITSCWNVDIFYLRSFWCFVRATTFLIFCGDNLLAFLRGRCFGSKHRPFGPFAKTICVMDFVFEIVFLKGRPFGPKGHPFEFARFWSKSTTQIVSKSTIGRLSFWEFKHTKSTIQTLQIIR